MSAGATHEEPKERELDPHIVWIVLIIVVALILRR